VSRVALDTNVLVYSEGIERSAADAGKVARSRELIRALVLSETQWLVPAQAFAELHSVLVRRGGLSPMQASARVRSLRDLCQTAPTGAETLGLALGAADEHHLQIYDAIIMAAAAESRCDLLVSEDLHDGFVWRGVTVTNPFGPSPDARLARLRET
jgi:predicted nucleic acid-binding protein